MAGKETVTIVVVSYNHEEFIGQCLDSCLLQVDEGYDLQIVVADDGSSDRTQAIVQDYARAHPDLFVPVLSSRNTGIAANFNRGIEAATGDYVAWLGGDDILMPEKVARQHRFLADRPKAHGCYHDAEVFAWPSDQTLGLFSVLYAGKAATADRVDARRMLDPRYQMLPSTVMVRRAHIRHRFDERLKFHNDFLFDLEVILPEGAYWRMDGVLARYRKHDKSIGQNPQIKSEMLEENLMVGAILEARYPALSPYVAKRQSYYIAISAIRALKAGNVRMFDDLCVLLRSRSGWARYLFMKIFGRALVSLDDPRNRKIAMKIRSCIPW